MDARSPGAAGAQDAPPEIVAASPRSESSAPGPSALERSTDAATQDPLSASGLTGTPRRTFFKESTAAVLREHRSNQSEDSFCTSAAGDAGLGTGAFVIPEGEVRESFAEHSARVSERGTATPARVTGTSLIGTPLCATQGDTSGIGLPGIPSAEDAALQPGMSAPPSTVESDINPEDVHAEELGPDEDDAQEDGSDAGGEERAALEDNPDLAATRPATAHRRMMSEATSATGANTDTGRPASRADSAPGASETPSSGNMSGGGLDADQGGGGARPSAGLLDRGHPPSAAHERAGGSDPEQLEEQLRLKEAFVVNLRRENGELHERVRALQGLVQEQGERADALEMDLEEERASHDAAEVARLQGRVEELEDRVRRGDEERGAEVREARERSERAEQERSKMKEELEQALEELVELTRAHEETLQKQGRSADEVSQLRGALEEAAQRENEHRSVAALLRRDLAEAARRENERDAAAAHLRGDLEAARQREAERIAEAEAARERLAAAAEEAQEARRLRLQVTESKRQLDLAMQSSDRWVAERAALENALSRVEGELAGAQAALATIPDLRRRAEAAEQERDELRERAAQVEADAEARVAQSVAAEVGRVQMEMERQFAAERQRLNRDLESAAEERVQLADTARDVEAIQAELAELKGLGTRNDELRLDLDAAQDARDAAQRELEGTRALLAERDRQVEVMTERVARAELERDRARSAAAVAEDAARRAAVDVDAERTLRHQATGAAEEVAALRRELEASERDRAAAESRYAALEAECARMREETAESEGRERAMMGRLRDAQGAVERMKAIEARLDESLALYSNGEEVCEGNDDAVEEAAAAVRAGADDAVATMIGLRTPRRERREAATNTAGSSRGSPSRRAGVVVHNGPFRSPLKRRLRDLQGTHEDLRALRHQLQQLHAKVHDLEHIIPAAAQPRQRQPHAPQGRAGASGSEQAVVPRVDAGAVASPSEISAAQGALVELRGQFLRLKSEFAKNSAHAHAVTQELALARAELEKQKARRRDAEGALAHERERVEDLTEQLEGTRVRYEEAQERARVLDDVLQQALPNLTGTRLRGGGTGPVEDTPGASSGHRLLGGDSDLDLSDDEDEERDPFVIPPETDTEPGASVSLGAAGGESDLLLDLSAPSVARTGSGVVPGLHFLDPSADATVSTGFVMSPLATPNVGGSGPASARSPAAQLAFGEAEPAAGAGAETAAAAASRESLTVPTQPTAEAGPTSPFDDELGNIAAKARQLRDSVKEREQKRAAAAAAAAAESGGAGGGLSASTPVRSPVGKAGRAATDITGGRRPAVPSPVPEEVTPGVVSPMRPPPSPPRAAADPSAPAHAVFDNPVFGAAPSPAGARTGDDSVATPSTALDAMREQLAALQEDFGRLGQATGSAQLRVGQMNRLGTSLEELQGGLRGLEQALAQHRSVVQTSMQGPRVPPTVAQQMEAAEKRALAAEARCKDLEAQVQKADAALRKTNENLASVREDAVKLSKSYEQEIDDVRADAAMYRAMATEFEEELKELKPQLADLRGKLDGARSREEDLVQLVQTLEAEHDRQDLQLQISKRASMAADVAAPSPVALNVRVVDASKDELDAALREAAELREANARLKRQCGALTAELDARPETHDFDPALSPPAPPPPPQKLDAPPTPGEYEPPELRQRWAAWSKKIEGRVAEHAASVRVAHRARKAAEESAQALQDEFDRFRERAGRREAELKEEVAVRETARVAAEDHARKMAAQVRELTFVRKLAASRGVTPEVVAAGARGRRGLEATLGTWSAAEDAAGADASDAELRARTAESRVLELQAKLELAETRAFRNNEQAAYLSRRSQAASEKEAALCKQLAASVEHLEAARVVRSQLERQLKDARRECVHLQRALAEANVVSAVAGEVAGPAQPTPAVREYVSGRVRREVRAKDDELRRTKQEAMELASENASLRASLRGLKEYAAIVKAQGTTGAATLEQELARSRAEARPPPGQRSPGKPYPHHGAARRGGGSGPPTRKVPKGPASRASKQHAAHMSPKVRHAQARAAGPVVSTRWDGVLRELTGKPAVDTSATVGSRLWAE